VFKEKPLLVGAEHEDVTAIDAGDLSVSQGGDSPAIVRLVHGRSTGERIVHSRNVVARHLSSRDR
jgi:hypothetical protein